MIGKLYLIPTPLGEEFQNENFGREYLQTITCLKFLIVEDIRTARRFLKKIDKNIVIDNIQFYELNEHTTEKDFGQFLLPVSDGYDVGLLSEAGCPGIADPGAQVVKIAHQNNILVVPMIGPSSITLALMASGLNGQSFCFNGYLPVKTEARKSKIIQIENRSKIENQTQIFIETPYRNQSLLHDIISYCQPNTQLTIACNLTQSDEFIKTMEVTKWKSNIPDINKKPTVFLMLSKIKQA